MSVTLPFDEMVDGIGGVRPYWRALLASINELGAAELSERAARLALPGGVACDPVPLLLDRGTFADLERGLLERADLLDACLADVYGQRTLLAAGIIAPSLLFGSSGFVRMGQFGDEGGRLLRAFAVDLVRGPEGQWRVVAQKAARLDMIGTMVDARRQMEPAVGELFSSYDLERPGAAFENWGDDLRRACASSGRAPRLAVLSRPRGSGWREDDLTLARRLDALLVETRDLTVRDATLWLKTVRGLRPVDGLLSQADIALLDPMEFADGIGDGIAGLMEAARAGTVHLLNDPRAALIEMPWLGACTDGIARHVGIGTLRLPDIAQHLVIGDEDCIAPWGASRWFRAALDRRAVAVRAEAEPAGPCVAYPAPVFSTVPSVAAGSLEPRPFVLRMFVVHDGGDWRVLPGGVARTPDAGGFYDAPCRLLRDVWVEAEDATRIMGPADRQGVTQLAMRGEGDLPSRAADDLFWLGRYVEQFETGIRVVAMIGARLARARPSPRERAELDVLFAVLAAWYPRLVWPGEGAGMGLLRNALAPLFADDERPAQLLGRLRSLADDLRDRLSVELFDTIDEETRALRIEAARLGPDLREGREMALLAFCRHALRFCAMFAGLTSENMVRLGARQFLDLGRRIERGAGLCLLTGALGNTLVGGGAARWHDGARLAVELFDSTLTYRARYGVEIVPATALALLFGDEGNPRSLLFQARAIEATLWSLEGDMDPGASLAAEGRVLLDHVAALADPDVTPVLADLSPRLEAVRGELFALSRKIMRRYFVVLAPHSLDSFGDGDTSESEGGA
ncbi:hypothetical protein AA103196_1690 [Ameyamaea chiangmaiensis NBRC 103196]|uniref:Circularly permuted type 2 ATP-grasp protein n=1 Tax=Ameyamaea chiangmaiensis TaxID=442969 RepID=A0A850PA29_9PROT|nr:circularly permuted type 2 ATP-grasp protein [Ameyamaea chiangmaiensis]MBS4074044.1 circularly permuted type 2 ATP-grasp protein [Ameyamaea chiangmaiensis]NVN39400.1 circularly permuted type 2 ATP-grasp protein [Ameyamaea chiangmaiensis]GBQ67459.1 hypothetical protein AA103196_1690 [Ameyamaea chiangmaiensis NBRC 103196]